MSVRVSLAAAAGLFFAVPANPATAAAAHSSGVASTNWTDASLDATKVDYFFSAMTKLTDFALAHPDVDLDAIAMEGSESEADYAKRMNADPKLRSIFTATGIDPVHYANASGALIGSMFGVGLAGKNLDPSKLPQAARYYLAHKAQIDARMAAFKAKGEALAKQRGDDDSE